MYQTRRQISLLKDKVKVEHQNSERNLIQHKKPLSLCKINLLKRDKTGSHEPVLKNSNAICLQSTDKDNVIPVDSVKLVQKKKQNKIIKQSIVHKKNILKDKINVVLQSPKRDCTQLKKPSNLCNINLRKKGAPSLHESFSKTSKSIRTQSIDKENVITVGSAKLVQKKKRNNKIKQSIAHVKNMVINDAENCIKILQKEQNEAENCPLLMCEEKNLDDFESLNTITKSLVYNKCLKNNSIPLNKKKKRVAVDVYDISADDDFKKEELNLKKSKKLKLQDQKVKTKHISKDEKNKIVKVTVKNRNKMKSFKKKKEIQYQFIKPLISAVSKMPELNMPKGHSSNNIPKSKQVEPPKLKENFKNSTKLFLRENTPVREFNSGVANEGSLNLGESLSKLLPHTSTPQHADNPCPTFTTTPEFNFVAQISKDIIIPISFEIVENVENCLDGPEENAVSEEENKLDYVAAVNDYSIVLFGSPEKVAEKNIDSKIQGQILHKKVIKQIPSKVKRPNIIQEKTDIEKKKEGEEEEKFYKSFNEHLSELDSYELCIE